jgi:hypothetical protein
VAQGEWSERRQVKRDVVAIQFFHRMNEKSQNRLRPLDQYDFGKIEKWYVDRAWTDKEFEGMCRKAEELGRRDVLLSMRLAKDTHDPVLDMGISLKLTKPNTAYKAYLVNILEQ